MVVSRSSLRPTASMTTPTPSLYWPLSELQVKAGGGPGAVSDGSVGAHRSRKPMAGTPRPAAQPTSP